MDSYEILGVTRESSDKEIEISYEDLKRKYDPSFNTSIRAYGKYREVLKAYEDIKNEKRRQMYNLKDNSEVSISENKEYKLFDFHSKEEKKKEEKVDYSNLEEINELVKEDIVINKRISYLYYLLNLRVDIEYSRKVNCDGCSSFITCPECDGVGAVYYREKQVCCPKCHGKGKVSEHCDKCNEEGYYNKEEKISFYVDNEIMTFNDLGDEYYDLTRSNLVINFDFYDKENIRVKGNEIYVNYYLDKNETKNGLSKEYYSELGAFKLEIPSFVSDEYKQEIIFNNKKIIFTFYNEEVSGDDKVYYLFINKKYKDNIIYFNSDYSKCSVSESEEYFNKLEVKDMITLNDLGEKGSYGGRNGDLVIKCKFTNKNNVEYVSEVEEIETSKIFNMLGGKINNLRHYGFKGSNYLFKFNDKYYLLNGNSVKKNKLKDYFLFRLISLFMWFIIPCIVFFTPYNEEMFFVLIGVLVGYLVLINVLMEVKI